jgi:hypothetical protein
MYNDLITREGVPYDVSSWKAKVPLKIKIFLWYLRQWVLLTKDNLAKRKWKGVLNVVSVVLMRQFCISFLIADDMADLEYCEHYF